MNSHGHIYMDNEDRIPAEDKARLDGYLRGRAEGDSAKQMLEWLKEEYEKVQEAASK